MYLCDVMSILRTNCVDNSFTGIVGVEVGLTVGSAVGVAVSVGSNVVSGETVGSSVTCGVSEVQVTLFRRMHLFRSKRLIRQETFLKIFSYLSPLKLL